MDIPDILGLLDEGGFADTDMPIKVAAIQGAIWDIEGRKPWPFLEASIDLNFDGTSGTATNLPSDFRAALRVKDMDTGRRVLPVRLDDAEDSIGNDYTRSGTPSFYYFEGGRLKVWPLPPSSTGRLRLKYVQWSDPIDETTVEASILIPRQQHEAIQWGSLIRLLDGEDDPELAMRYESHYERRLALMEEALFRLQYDRSDHIAITDPDDYDWGFFD